MDSPKSKTSFKVGYDDQAMDIIDAVQQALNELGVNVTIEDDDEPHDGFCIFNVIKKED